MIFFLWGWLKVGTRDELFGCSLDAAAEIKKCEYRLRRTARNLRMGDMQSALRFTVGFSNIYFKLRMRDMQSALRFTVGFSNIYFEL
jgi:hypothetical protein